MPVRNILCPVDFTRYSDKAIERACAMATQHDAKVHFVHVYEPEFENNDMSKVPDQPDSAIVEQREKRLEEISLAYDGQSHCELVFGFPAGSLIGYASTNAIDVIVMGTHGRSGPSRLVMGSVAESVMRNASCPVMVVHAEPELVAAKQGRVAIS